MFHFSYYLSEIDFIDDSDSDLIDVFLNLNAQIY